MKKESKIKRSKWFLLLMCCVLCLGVLEVQAKDAKNIILIISDGMQLEHEVAASRYLHGRDYGLSFHFFPYRTSVSTFDVTAYNKYAPGYGAIPYDPATFNPMVGYDVERGGKRPYPWQKYGIDDTYFIPGNKVKPFATDSASAATAWATGYKTDDGNLAWLPGDPNVGGNRNNDGSLKTIAEILREEKGMAIGVVSTVPFNHATPAGHVSHNKDRSCYHLTSKPSCTRGIAEEILKEIKPEVVIGGGHPTWSGTSYMTQALLSEVKSDPDYIVVERQAGADGGTNLLNAARDAKEQGRKLFGLFGGSGGNFEPPVPTDNGTSVVNRATIENPLLKDASLAALKVLSQDPDGFFLMIEQGDVDWANHANDYKWLIGTMWDLDETVKTVVNFINRPGDDIHWSNTIVMVTADHSNSYMRIVEKLHKGELPEQVPATDPTTQCPDLTGSSTCSLYPNGEVTYATTSHTNELVTLYALGGFNLLKDLWKFEGSWYPCTRIIDNTQLFHAMTDAAGAPQPSNLNVIVEQPRRCFDFGDNDD
jgi:alkaline phosphatase